MSGTVEQKNGYKIVSRRAADVARSAGGYSTGLFATPRNSQQQDYYRPRPWGVTDLQNAIDEFDWQEILEFNRQLFAQSGNLGSAIVQRNSYAVGCSWEPQYFGKHKHWGNEVGTWLRDYWYPNSNVRGGVFDFQTDLFLSGVAWDVDGDDVAAFAVREDGFPQIKYYGAHEIGSRDSRSEVKGGKFDGAKICNGIIVDRNKRFLGVNVLGEKASDDDQISAFSCDLSFDPEFRNVVRGIGKPARVLLDSFDVDDIDTFLKRGVKLDSSVGLLRWTEAGEAPTASDIIGARSTNPPATAVAQDVKVNRIYGGEIYELRANLGEKMEGLKSERPHPNSEAFIMRLERRVMRALRWFYELLDPSRIGGASVRMIQDQARLSVACQQKCMRRRARRKLQFAVGQAMKAGFIPENDDGGDFLKWGFTLPAQLTVDQGYDEDADRNNLLIGSTTMLDVCGKKGKWWEDNREQRKTENFNLIDKAMAIVQYAKETHGQEVTLREALDMMQRDAPNPRPPTLPQDGTAKDAKEEEKE
jgi:hypothetical protein